jgi:hypothetical protein
MSNETGYWRGSEIIPAGIVTDKGCHCWLGWQCEKHPDKLWERDGGGAGDRCDNENCPYKEGGQRLGPVWA